MFRPVTISQEVNEVGDLSYVTARSPPDCGVVSGEEEEVAKYSGAVHQCPDVHDHQMSEEVCLYL